MEAESEGMTMTIGILNSARLMERDRTRDSQVARWNGLKGHTPETSVDGHEIRVADVVDEPKLLRQGYVRIGTYPRDENERGVVERGI